MQSDDTVTLHMEWMKRLADRPRMHLGALEECTNGLADHLQEIVSKGDIQRAQIAKNTLAMYIHVLAACREKGTSFMLQRLDLCLAELNKVLQVSEEHGPVLCVTRILTLQTGLARLLPERLSTQQLST